MVPTSKQKAVFQKVVKEGQDFRKAMIDVGYSDTSTRNPGHVVVNTKGWQILLDEYMPEDKLAQVHKEGLSSVKKVNKIVGRDSDGNPEYDWVDVEDYQTRHKYLETAYKLRGRLANKEPEDTPTVNINILNLVQKTYGGSTEEVCRNS